MNTEIKWGNVGYSREICHLHRVSEKIHTFLTKCGFSPSVGSPVLFLEGK